MPETTTQQTKDPAAAIVRIVESADLKAQIKRQLPKQLDMDRFVRICLTTIRTNEKLQQCEPLSIISAVMEASALGLELDPILGHGYLVPFHSTTRKCYVCTFIPGFRGFVHLMRNSGLVDGVNGEIVREGDEIGIELGTVRQLRHSPNFDLEGRDLEKNWKGAYATVVFKSGWRDFEYMTGREINAIANGPRARGGSLWDRKKDPQDTNVLIEMWKKTPIRRIAKRMPLSPINQNVIRAAILDEIRETPAADDLPIAPMLETDAAINLLPQTEEPRNNGTAVPAAAQPEKETVQRKSDQKKGKGQASKGAPAAKEQPPEFLSQAQQGNLTRLALEEKNMDKTGFVNFLGRLGYDNLAMIPKKDFARIWQELANEPRRK
jgi:recombination protein RecT